jgi:cytochrome b
MLDWHRLAGYCLAALLVFRFFWGVVGSETARFSHFVRGPLAVARYIGRDMFRQGARPRAPGHNPLGGWSVVAMLLLLTTQVGLGMIAVDVDGIESGPLSHLVEFDTGRRAAGLHALLFNILLALIALHVVAALAYLLFGRENLVGAMLSGRRHWFGERPELAFASRRRAVTVFAASATLVAALSAVAAAIISFCNFTKAGWLDQISALARVTTPGPGALLRGNCRSAAWARRAISRAAGRTEFRSGPLDRSSSLIVLNAPPISL